MRGDVGCCIFAWPSRIAARSGVMPAGPVGPAFACLFTPALLRVETIFREKRVLKVTPPRSKLTCINQGEVN